MWEEADSIDPTEANNRVFRILFGKEGKAKIAMEQYQDWLSGMPAKPLLSALLGISDPNDVDTDRDGMSDGYEYWFTQWNLEENIWEMNPLTGSDVYRDSDETPMTATETVKFLTPSRLTILQNMNREYMARK